MPSPPLDVRVAAVRALTPRINEYLLVSLDGSPLPRYEPGAHIELHLQSNTLGRLVRHYSLIGGMGAQHDPSPYFRIAVQRESERGGSAHIHEFLKAGSELKISWPKNNFVLGRNAAHVLLIAGGIGITPIFSMLRSAVYRQQSFNFVYSGRTVESMAYLANVMALAGVHGSLHLSGEPPIDHLDLPMLLAAQPPGVSVYVCGPPGMVNATYAAAAAVGLAKAQVHSEQFGALRADTDRSFEVIFERSGKVVTVGPDTSLLDAAEAAGLSLLSDCRRGECGLCPLPILSTDSAIEHRDRYLSDEEKAANKSLCLCVSRLQGGRLVLDA